MFRTQLYADPTGRFVHDVVLESCRQNGNKTALIDTSCDRRFTFAEYGSLVESLARGLISAGLDPGEVIAIFLPNSWEFAITYHAATLAGGIPTLLNPSYREREIRCQLDNSGAAFLITDAPLLENVNLAAGDQTPWKKYLADDCMYFDEKGRNMNKAALVADITPLPTGDSGTIKVVKPQSHIERNVAILSYDMDETESVFGQDMTARYHATDSWMRRNGQWQIVAGQVLRYYEDPAPGKVNGTKISWVCWNLRACSWKQAHDFG